MRVCVWRGVGGGGGNRSWIEQVVQLKRGKLISSSDLVLFCCTFIRSILSLAVPVLYLRPSKNDLEGIPKRGFTIICPGVHFCDALEKVDIKPITDNNNKSICERTFKSIVSGKENRLNRLLPEGNDDNYSLRWKRNCKSGRNNVLTKLL